MALSQKAKRFQQHRVTLLFDKPCCAQDAHRHSWCFPLSVRVLTKVDPDAPDMDFLSGCACRNQPLDHVLGKDYEGVTKIEKRSEALEPSAVPQTGARVHPVEGRYEWHISLPPEGGESCLGRPAGDRDAGSPPPLGRRCTPAPQLDSGLRNVLPHAPLALCRHCNQF